MKTYSDLVMESVASCGLFRSYIVGASFPNLMAERVRQSHSLALRRSSHCKRLNLDVPVLDLAVSRLSSFVSRLDNNVLIGRELAAAYALVSTRELREAFFGYPPELDASVGDCPVFRRAAQAALRARASELVFRIQEELARPSIYPVFNTLTTDPQFDYIFEPGCDVLKLWFRKVSRVLGKFTYCSVLERGPEGKLHWHVLMCFDELRFSDPNRSRAMADHREVNELKRLWPFGFSTPIAVRFGPTDIYGALGWRWPMDRKTRLPLKTSSSGQVANYMSGYVTKQPFSELNGCRTRMTRGFGLRRLVQVPSRAYETVMTLGRPNWLQTVRWPVTPPRRLLLRLAFSGICVTRFLRPLPRMRVGSVSAASEMLRTQTFSPMSAGALPFPKDGSRCLEPFRSQNRRCSIGGLT